MLGGISQTLVLLVVIVWRTGIAYPSGPPIDLDPAVCMSMRPQHSPNQPQNTTSPYRIRTNSSCFEPGHTLKVTLKGSNTSESFKGLFVMAKKPGEQEFSYGEFNNMGDSDLKTFDCFNQSSSAIGHNETSNKTFTLKVFEWTAPSNNTEVIDVIEFVATVVQNYTVYWVKAVLGEIHRCNISNHNESLGQNETDNDRHGNGTFNGTDFDQTTSTADRPTYYIHTSFVVAFLFSYIICMA